MHILLSMLIIAAAIATVAVSGIAMWLYWRRQTQSLRPTLRLELRNDGNVPGRYELKAEDPTGSLHFVWRLNGTPLGASIVTPEWRSIRLHPPPSAWRVGANELRLHSSTPRTVAVSRFEVSMPTEPHGR